MSWICGVLSVLWLSLSVFILSKSFEFKSKWSTYILAGICVTSPAITFTNASFIYESDTYSLALFFSCCAIYCHHKLSHGYLLSSVFICFSCCFYQAYFSVALTGYLTLLLIDIINNKAAKDTVFKGAKSLVSLILGLLFYLLGYKLSLFVLNIDPNDVPEAFNRVKQAQLDSGNSIQLIIDTYHNLWDRFTSPLCYHSKVVMVLNSIISLVSIAGLFFLIRARQLKAINILLLLGLLLLLPFGINITYFLSKGLSHELMIFSYIFFYIIALIIGRNVIQTLSPSRYVLKFSLKASGAACLTFIIFSHIIYSNHVYLQKQFTYASTIQLTQRILKDMEEVPNFQLGYTPIIFQGVLSNNNHPINTVQHLGFEHIQGNGIQANHGVTYGGTLDSIYQTHLATPLPIAKPDVVQRYQTNEELRNMPSFPAKGYCKIIDNCLVVKLSEPDVSN